MSDLHAMPITNILLPISPAVLVIRSRWAKSPNILLASPLTTIIQPICIVVCGGSAVCVTNYPQEMMQPSSSTRATIVSAENQNLATIVTATLLFCNHYILWESNNPGKTRGRSWNARLKSHASQEDRAVIRGVQRESISRFLRRDHDDDGCSCNHRAVSPRVMASLFHWLLYLSSTVFGFKKCVY